MTVTATTTLALETQSPLGQAALAEHPVFAPLLAQNPHLHPDAWTLLWDGSRDLHARKDLLALPLTAAQVDHVIATDTRLTIRRQLVGWRTTTSEQAARLYPRLAGNDKAMRDWLSGGRYPASIEDALIATRPGHLQVRYRLSSPHQFDQDAMLTILDQADQPVERMSRALAITVHPNAAPDTVAVARAAIDALHGQANASGTLITAMTRRIAEYGYAMTRPWDQADTPAELDLLHILRDGKVPDVTERRITCLDQARRARGTAVPLGPWHDTVLNETTTTWSARVAARHLEEALDAAGPDAWTTAATLLADDYPGTVDALLATVAALGRDTAPAIRITRSSAPATGTRGRA